MDTKQIYEKVQEHYSLAANTTNNTYGHKVAKAFGYTEDELEQIPKDANLGLSCGNPSAIAKLKEGETVIDLGSGAGFDVFLAAKKVGVHGKAIGIDMNNDMLERANKNKEEAGAENVLFVKSPITKIDLTNECADCIISNCVVNLVPEHEKQLVFNETFRLLKPGGRLAISDILLKKELPDELKKSMALYVGCISGASRVNEYEEYLRNAGFRDILIVDNKHDLNVYNDTPRNDARSSCCGKGCAAPASVDDPLVAFMSQSKHVDFNEWAGSFQVYALKPSS
ncbi:hypothetical protein EPUS_00650 [Endocarpon pusillum Z07020]|uniref:Arsenite methyltransferase n=1 Tax=Endocarpon pusillum (strain Z07020 / HMAS-L-300199) TaxID=1263415 RepID=U1GIN7_ENDPU|nr:uncharacterized protein EPUS_00650 [Endocarpon pusillum Z07020]ERF71661.1 hypothetical protein EPUS_00650 [Endocarpon pusillum Z07020]